MKTEMKYITMLLLAVAVLSCTSRRTVVTEVKHMAQSGWAGSAGVYADRIPNKSILREDGGDSGTTVFYCLRIGLYDSTDVTDKKLVEAREKYYQLDMYRDWVLLDHGDSIVPVFYQPVPRKMEKLTEQVLVFEVPRGFQPSTLVYKDPYKLLGNRQTMLLHENTN